MTHPSRFLEAPMFRRVLLLLALPLAAACSKKGDKPTRPPPLVAVQDVKPKDVPVEVKAPVDLRPIELVNVNSKVSGYLDTVLVDRGDKVSKGELLAVVRPSDLPDQLAAARSAAALAKSNYDRAQELAPKGIVSQQDLQSATAAWESAQANLSSMATKLGETRIESPIDGWVSDRMLDPGALVGQSGGGGTILVLVRIDTLRAFVNADERSAGAIVIGQPAHVEVDALPGKSFSGQVARVAPAFDPTTRTLAAEVRLANPDGVLRPGMYGRGAIVTAVHPGAAVVPVESVQITNDQDFVFVVDGDTVHRRRIQTGVDGGDWLEVTDGIKVGDKIVVAGLEGLSDGSKVRIASPDEQGVTQAAMASPGASPGTPAAAPSASPSSGRKTTD